MKYVLQINGSKLEELNLTEVQEKIMWAIVDIAEKNHDFTVYIVNQEITDKLNIKSRATVGKVLNKLVENGLLIKKGVSTYKFNPEYAEFKEVAETKANAEFTNYKIDISAEEFLPVAEWLQDVATAEDYQSYSLAYRTLRDTYGVYTENEKLIAKAYLIDKVNRYNVDEVAAKINQMCNNCEFTELISLIS